MASFITINPEKKGGISSFFSGSRKNFPDYFIGSIVNLSDIEFGKNNEHKLKKGATSICEIEGEWTNFIKFDQKKYWNIGDYKVGPFVKDIYILKSDSSFRQDVNFLIQGDLEQSQKFKELYEEDQRCHRELRANYILGNNK